ncbi:MAG: adenosylcobinamide-GDP ribazoletransferase [Kosmotogales bacterium]|nr:adenosylcobinamide-GDP ribazoletransferase [Kosmotogales bacterium]
MLKALVLMLQFLTRIPINIKIDMNKETLGKGTFFFPFIGMMIGGIASVVYYGLGFVNNDIASLGAVFTIIAVTGGLHLDGLSDTADGFFSSRKRERILEIMKDSRVGVFGVVFIIFDILFKYVIIKEMNVHTAIIAIVLSCGIGRVSASTLFTFGKSARKDGLGNMFVGNDSKKYFFAALVIFLAIGIYVSNIVFIIAIVSSISFTLLFMKYSYKIIGGLTGDVYGAACELSEIISLFVFLGASMWI